MNHGNKQKYSRRRFYLHTNNIPLLGILTLIEYYIVFIEYVRIIVYFKYSFNQEKVGDFFISKMTIFRLLKYIINEKKKYPIYIFIIESILQIFFNIVYIIEIDNFDIFYKIIINFYELIYFRTLSTLFFDVIVNYIVYYILNLSNTINVVLFILSLIIFILMIKTSLLIFSHYTLFKIKEKSYYPYDIVTNYLNNFFMILKIDLNFIRNLAFFNVTISKTKYLTLLAILLVIFMLIIYFSIYFKYPSLYFQNYNFHKCRFCFILLCFFWTIITFCNSYKYQKVYYFFGLTFIVFSLIFIFSFDSKFYYKITTKDKLNYINNLFYIISIRNEKDDLNKKLFIEKLNFHYLNCDNCDFCKAYKSEKDFSISRLSKTKTVSRNVKFKKSIKHTENSFDNELFILFTTFLNMFHKSLLNSKQKTHFLIEKFYDLFSIYQYCFESRKVTYKLKCEICALIYKYNNKNENMILNLIAIYQELFESKDEYSLNIISNIKVYLLFVEEITQILERINNYFYNEIKSPINFLKLGIELKKLRNKKNLEFLTSRLKTNDYCIDIITYILEEITNVPINKDKGFVKENLLMNEEFLNFYYSKSNNIVISCNSKLNNYIIEKTGKDMVQFIGKDITSLFPKEFRHEGIIKLAKSLKTNHSLKKFDFLINSYIKKNEQIISENDDLNHQNLIENKFKRFSLNYKLYFDYLENDDFYINGEYNYAFDEIVITKIFKNPFYDFQEYIFAIDINKKRMSDLTKFNKINLNAYSNYSKHLKRQSNNSLIKVDEFFKKEKENIIKFNEIQFQKIYSINKKSCDYKIYSSMKIPKKSLKSNQISLGNINSIFDEDSKILKIPDSISMANSFNSQNSVSSHTNKEQTSLNLKVENKFKQYQWRFVSITKITFIFCLFMIFFCIVSLFIELNQNNNLLDSYSVYTQLRTLNRLFYNLITSILAVNCIGNPGEKNCTNYYKLYSEKFNEINNINYPSFNYSIYENPFKIKDFGNGLDKLKKKIYSLNDERVTNIFNEQFIYTHMSLKGKNVSIENTTSTFVGALGILFNSLLVIIESNKYYNHSVYIFSMANFDFENIYDQENIEDWQKEYYNLVINYQKYLHTWVNIQLSVGENTNNRLKSLSKIVIIFLTIFCLSHLFLFFLLFYFVFAFENLYIMSVNKLMRKFKNQNFRKFFVEKYEVLKILIKFFQENPVSLIHEMQKIYSEYHHLDNIKKRSISKDNKFDEKETNLNGTEEKQYYPISAYRIVTAKFYLLIIIILLYHLSIFILFLAIWVINVDKILNVFEIITDNTVAACSGYNMFALCQIMLLANQTQAEISVNMNFDKDNYLIYESTRSIYTIFDLERRRQSVKNLIKTTNDYLDLNCDTFYSDIKDIRFEEIDIEHPDEGFRTKYPKFCEVFHILEYKNDQLFYKPVFYEINKFVNSVNKRDYNDYIDYLKNGNLYYMCDLQFLLYRPFRSWFNDIVYNDAINRSIKLEKTILFTNLGVIISSEFIIFTFLYYQLFNKLKHINAIIVGVKNVFKILK